jgi:pantoate--beta-alanine ligase
MRRARTAAELDDALARGPCVLVPTMGALHAGHEALIDEAVRRRQATGWPVVVSIFVNPTQFNERADFARYPRTLENDEDRCARLGVDVVFAPGVDDIYPEGPTTRPELVPDVAKRPRLEDAWRPGHFEGVCVVCDRLFELTRAREAIFGEKDWQQLRAVTDMAARTRPDLTILGVPTVRERDGLALSSRNVHLTEAERSAAAANPRAMTAAGASGDPAHAEARAGAILREAELRVEYAAVRDAHTLLDARPDRPARVLIAARAGDTRLIDNAPWPGFTLNPSR